MVPVSYHCNFNAICDSKTLCAFFACLAMCACQRDTNGSILYYHAKYEILLVKVKKKCQIEVITNAISTFNGSGYFASRGKIVFSLCLGYS